MRCAVEKKVHRKFLRTPVKTIFKCRFFLKTWCFQKFQTTAIFLKFVVDDGKQTSQKDHLLFRLRNLEIRKNSFFQFLRITIRSLVTVQFFYCNLRSKTDVLNPFSSGYVRLGRCCTDSIFFSEIYSYPTPVTSLVPGMYVTS